MEIKIVCNCGTKYKFDVEPVYGRMPAPVTCPSCGADGTAQANQLIQARMPMAALPVAESIGVPVAAALASAPPLRINAPAAVAIPAPPPIGNIPMAAPLAAGLQRAARPKARSPNKTKAVLGTIVTVVLVVVGACAFGYKWFRRISAVAQIAAALGDASVKGDEAPAKQNLMYEDAAVLFIRCTNQTEVAQACQDYWKDTLHRKLTVSSTPHDVENKGEFELVPPHNGYVRILGTLDWPLAECEGLAKFLSQKFDTLAFAYRSEHVADTYRFGVYEQGVQKLHAKMDVKLTGGDDDEVVTVEGKEWAMANGYNRGQAGFKDFGEEDAEKITQHLGMKLWDEPEGAESKGTFMKEE